MLTASLQTLHDDGPHILVALIVRRGLGGRPGMSERRVVTQWGGPRSAGRSEAARREGGCTSAREQLWKHNCEAAEPCSRDDRFH